MQLFAWLEDSTSQWFVTYKIQDSLSDKLPLSNAIWG